MYTYILDHMYPQFRLVHHSTCAGHSERNYSAVRKTSVLFQRWLFNALRKSTKKYLVRKAEVSPDSQTIPFPETNKERQYYQSPHGHFVKYVAQKSPNFKQNITNWLEKGTMHVKYGREII